MVQVFRQYDEMFVGEELDLHADIAYCNNLYCNNFLEKDLILVILAINFKVVNFIAGL